MRNRRTHYVTTTDGVSIGGTVHGRGPAIVFWHGAYGDGDLDWQALLPHLVDRFTCYLPSWRGRGLSDEHSDVGYGRRVADVLDFVESFDEPSGLVGWSGGANPAVAAAAQSDSVNALALYEPTMGSMMDEEDRAALGGAVTRMGELAAEGRLTDAVRAVAGFPFSAAEIEAAEDAGYFEAAGRYVPNLLRVFHQLTQHEGPTADDPATLSAVSARVLILRGADTKPFWIRSAQHVANHVPDARIEAISGAGHAGPLTHPEGLADALIEFFTSPQHPA